MAKDIIIPAGQPVVTSAITHGAAVTADQFAMDFDVEVDSNGCYVVDFKLLASFTGGGLQPGPGSPVIVHLEETVLQDASAKTTPLGLNKGKTSFRVTPSAPAPAGASALPAPP